MATPEVVVIGDLAAAEDHLVFLVGFRSRTAIRLDWAWYSPPGSGRPA